MYNAPVTPSAGSLSRAYAECEALARSHYENFPVASWLLPRPMRPHVAALYAFARVADDIADEGHATAAERQRELSAWQRRLHAAVASAEAATPDRDAAGTPDTLEAFDRGNLILTAIAHSIRTLDLPLPLFDDLVSAFGQDTMTNRYASWADVFDYCRRSANPVGRLVLCIAGYRDPALDRSSDALCTALQLTNFWQDFGRDWRAGRLYVPREAIADSGADEADLARGAMSAAWAAALERCVAVTRELFREGRAVCDGVRGRLRAELRFTWLGGMRILERVDSGRLTLFEHRPALGAVDLPVLLWRAARWTPARL
jgi:hydroxysqualene synthase